MTKLDSVRAEHYKTMKACQMHGTLRSPHSNPEDAFEDDLGCVLPEADCEGIVDCIKKSHFFTKLRLKRGATT
ncbi:hypothetical protein EUGRSUZ_E03965 [Eucalyptus grandis]|uniref:Uncharacterized protein n=2 Tax=Eucalyptus grandis TaxID=71139 RepID=A0ACC3L0T5_EUCGR|nr:hypothetical protein EUGRSUZ_E03965 [Eucalyptus grandis]